MVEVWGVLGFSWFPGPAGGGFLNVGLCVFVPFVILLCWCIGTLAIK